jgi:hypothetical protein
MLTNHEFNRKLIALFNGETSNNKLIEKLGIFWTTNSTTCEQDKVLDDLKYDLSMDYAPSINPYLLSELK